MLNDSNRVSILIDPSPRRISVKFNGQIVGDTKEALIVHERGRVPVYYFPSDGVRTDYLVPTSQETQCAIKGTVSYWTVVVGDRSAENAAWSYQTPLAGSEVLAGYISFDWDQMDAWFEEDEEIFEHARDPYRRVDALRSSRHVKVVVDDVTVAETDHPVLVFETGTPVRYYIAPEDIDMSLLEASDVQTRCPYKGIASYWSLVVQNKRYDNSVWSYQEPIPELPQIKGLYAFYGDHTKIYVDGVLQESSETYASAIDSFNAREISMTEGV
jgi:uncharacterized protein (DUF427 family)